MEKHGDWRDEVGYIYSDDRVWNPDGDGFGRAVVTQNGDLGEFIAKPQEMREEAVSRLWRQLAPVEIAGLTFRKNTKVWHNERDLWLRAEILNVYGNGEPVITFRKVDITPVEHVKLRASEIVDLVESSTLQSQQEVNDELESLVGLDVR